MTLPVTAYWKDDIADLKTHATAVLERTGADRVSARAAAACLQGIVGLVARRWTLDVAQRTCAELVRYQPAWSTSFLGELPHQNGYVNEQTQLIATVARSLLPLAGADNLRAALSFWASEDDPSVWQSLSAA